MAYQTLVAQLQGSSDLSWRGVQSAFAPSGPVCLCGFEARSELELRLHVDSASVGTAHGDTPERRPRLGAAWLLYDVHAHIPQQGFVRVGRRRLTSRGARTESSTSSEERAVAEALPDVEALVPDGTHLTISSDNRAVQLVWERVVSARPTVRREVRTPEMGELRVARDAYRRMQRRGVRVEVSWEPAEHNRLRKGTADGGSTFWPASTWRATCLLARLQTEAGTMSYSTLACLTAPHALPTSGPLGAPR